MDLDDLNPTFVDDLRRSDLAVRHVAAWLRRLGHNVTVPPLRVRPSVAERAAYRDAGDLYIHDIPPDPLRVEVKRLWSVSFTCAADFPFASLFIMAVHKWTRATPRPYAVVVLDAAMHTAAVIDGRTANTWHRVTYRGSGREETVYACAPGCASFFRVGD